MISNHPAFGDAVLWGDGVLWGESVIWSATVGHIDIPGTDVAK
jgi:hypothetical protein